MIGKRLSHFKILEKIGEGGMGVVYRAHDENLGRDVALKVLPPDLVGDEERRLRFIREARLAASVTHPNIATVHEIDEDQGVVFIAMELVAGDSLKERLDGRPLDLTLALRVAVAVADGLSRAHKSQIVHRDLKPENVMLDPDGHVKILDFGLAKPFGPEVEHQEDQLQTVSAGMTRDGRILGTVAYMSPEQARGLDLDYRSDLFSLGVLIYEMVTGRSPFKGDTVSDTLSAILRDEAPPIARFNGEVPAELERIIGRCLEKDADRRYDDTASLERELSELKRASDSHSLPKVSLETRPPRAEKRVRPWLIGAAGLAVAALALVGARWIGPGAPPPVKPLANSLAVLPFQQLSDDDGSERLGQILQELVITDLSEVRGMRVFSSQRLFDLQKQLGRGQKQTIDRDMATAVASRAGASTMLTGTMTRRNEGWVVTAHLIDVSDGTIIRSERLDGADVFAVADALSPLIRRDLGLVGEGTDALASRRGAPSVEAYDAYLRGVEQLNALQFTEAEASFQASLQQDPDFDKARYKLAIARWWNQERQGGSPEGAGPIPTLESLLEDGHPDRRVRMLAEASLALVQEKYTKAQSGFRQVTEAFPEEKEGWYGLGEALFHGNGNQGTDESTRAFERALDLDPSFRLAYSHLGEYYQSRRLFDENLSRVARFIEAEPDEPYWHQEYARIAVASGQDGDLESVIRESLEKMPDDEQRQHLLIGVADAYSERGDVEGRSRLLSSTVETLSADELSAPLMARLGWAELETGHPDEALPWFERALERDERQRSAQRGRVRTYLMQERFEDALQAAARLANQDPESRDGYLARLEALLGAGDFEAADELVETALDTRENDEQRWAVLLEASQPYRSVGLYERAEELVRQAMEISPDRGRTAVGMLLAHAQLGQGRYDEVERDLLALEKEYPEDSRIQTLLAVALIGNRKPDEAEKRVRELRKGTASRDDLEQLLALSLAAQGRWAEAAEPAKRALSMHADRTAHALLSWILVAGEIDVARGMKMAEQAMALPPSYGSPPGWLSFVPTAEHALGLAYLKQGDYERARAQLQRAREIQPERALIRRHLDEAQRALAAG